LYGRVTCGKINEASGFEITVAACQILTGVITPSIPLKTPSEVTFRARGRSLVLSQTAAPFLIIIFFFAATARQLSIFR
jgi:hypothetical protein